MAKLDASKTAGWNAGKNYYAKMMRIEDVVVDPEISKVFVYQNKIFEEITRSIRDEGYDKSQPIVVWKERNVVLDGHTRLAAAKTAGLEEIPAVDLEFEDKEDAILYTFERQVIRRNLTSGEILTATQMLCGRAGHRKHDGKGRAADILAERLGISRATVCRAKKVLEEAPEEAIEAIRKGEKTIGETYKEITKPKADPPKDASEKFDKVTQEAREAPVITKENFEEIKEVTAMKLISEKIDKVSKLLRNFLLANHTHALDDLHLLDDLTGAIDLIKEIRELVSRDNK
ncbi:MAG: ParB N-terminal domain-containing protein [Spirochaetaceae bacterium]|jgi:ParB family chromosome partitioning protein|nr:ParB N-terminal domain-containing protein [Spirochaetaceae bacterium]